MFVLPRIEHPCDVNRHAIWTGHAEMERSLMNLEWAQYWIGLFADGTDELMTLYNPQFHFEDINFGLRSEEHKSELQSLMRISYAVFFLNTKNTNNKYIQISYN